jgi:hypothetical protein
MTPAVHWTHHCHAIALRRAGRFAAPCALWGLVFGHGDWLGAASNSSGYVAMDGKIGRPNRCRQRGTFTLPR